MAPHYRVWGDLHGFFLHVPVAFGPLKPVRGPTPSQGSIDSRFRTSALDKGKLEILTRMDEKGTERRKMRTREHFCPDEHFVLL